MGFFTNDWSLANASNSPSVGKTQAFRPGAGSLSSSMNLNPSQQQFGNFPNQSNTQQQTNWGAPSNFNTQQGFTGTSSNQNIQNPFAANVPWWQQGYATVQPYQPQQQQQQPQASQAIDGGNSDWQDNTPTSEFNPEAFGNMFGDIDWGSMALGMINPGLGLASSLYNSYGQEQPGQSGMFGDLGSYLNNLFGNEPVDLNQQSQTNNGYYDNASESVAPNSNTNVGSYNYDTYEGIGVGGSDVGVEDPNSSGGYDASNDGGNDFSGGTDSTGATADDYSSYDSPDDSSGPSDSGWGW